MTRTWGGGGEGRKAPLLLVVLIAVAAGAGGCGSGAKTAATTRPETVGTATNSMPSGGSSRRAPLRVVPGQVQVPPGPFTDRVRFRTLRFTSGRRPRVIGSMLNRVDVSDMIVLELRADFYDAAGHRLGNGAVLFNEAEPFNRKPLRFTIVAHRAAPSAVAAVLTIPQFVNE